jgi:plastocyanin
VRRLAAPVAALAVLAPAAYGQAQVQAVDGTEANHYENRWSTNRVTIRAGEAVTWSFSGSTVLHNVASDSPNWSFRNDDPKVAPPPASFTFTTPGEYRFVCEIHESTMWGDVVVTDPSGAPPPPPPPPPLSEQPWPNDQQAPRRLDVADEKRPRVSRVRATAVRNGARVRFRLSERARVRVRFRKAGVTVKTARRWFGAGARRLTVRDRRMRGAYRVEVLARDRAGNRSRTASDRVAIR